MKRTLGIIVMLFIIAGAAGLVYTSFIGPRHAEACGWGTAGGGDYAPQQQGSLAPFSKAPSMTKEQAYDIIDNHIKKLNPGLKIGEIVDNGGFFEAEVLSEEGELVEHVGVDKQSGRLMVLN